MRRERKIFSLTMLLRSLLKLRAQNILEERKCLRENAKYQSVVREHKMFELCFCPFSCKFMGVMGVLL